MWSQLNKLGLTVLIHFHSCQYVQNEIIYKNNSENTSQGLASTTWWKDILSLSYTEIKTNLLLGINKRQIKDFLL